MISVGKFLKPGNPSRSRRDLGSIAVVYATLGLFYAGFATILVLGSEVVPGLVVPAVIIGIALVHLFAAWSLLQPARWAKIQISAFAHLKF